MADPLIRLQQLSLEPRMGTGTAFNNMNCVAGLIELCLTIPNAHELKMVEIGSFLGVSTEVFCLFFKHVTAIDIWGLDNKYGEANKSVSIINLSWDEIKNQCATRLASYDNVSIVHNFNELVVDNFEDESLDFVYIDGNHKLTNKDVDLWIRKIKKNGYIGGHDHHLVRNILTRTENISLTNLSVFKDTSWLKKHE